MPGEDYFTQNSWHSQEEYESLGYAERLEWMGWVAIPADAFVFFVIRAQTADAFVFFAIPAQFFVTFVPFFCHPRPIFVISSQTGNQAKSEKFLIVNGFLPPQDDKARTSSHSRRGTSQPRLLPQALPRRKPLACAWGG